MVLLGPLSTRPGRWREGGGGQLGDGAPDSCEVRCIRGLPSPPDFLDFFSFPQPVKLPLSSLPNTGTSSSTMSASAMSTKHSFSSNPYGSSIPGVEWVSDDAAGASAIVSASRITSAALKQYLESNYTGRYVVQVCLLYIRCHPMTHPITPAGVLTYQLV